MAALGIDSMQAKLLRATLTRRLIAEGTIHDQQVAAAFRTVPRHLFTPRVPLRIAYADDVVLMKRNDAGVAISSVSQPSIVALMLEQAAIRPGDRVLEIGSGGYNAALLRELTGPDGSVTTIDIDAEVTDRARTLLDQAGYGDVRVIQVDGEYGVPEQAPYDRILVTVTAWDIAPAWVDQLRAGGRIVVPLRTRGQTRSIAFDRVDGRLESRSMTLCGFVSMQGAGAYYERFVPLGDDISLSFDEDQEADAHPVEGVLDQPREQLWSGVVVSSEEPLLDLNLWLATTLPGYCVVAGERAGVRPSPSMGAAATATRDSLAYLTSRPVRRSPPSFRELGLSGHGPDAGDLMARMVDQVRIWDAQYRRGPGPAFQAHAIGTELPPGFWIARRHSYIGVSWPV
ncbi:methyltransferase, FxLD system [Kribbella sp. NPDC055071]